MPVCLTCAICSYHAKWIAEKSTILNFNVYIIQCQFAPFTTDDIVTGFSILSGRAGPAMMSPAADAAVQLDADCDTNNKQTNTTGTHCKIDSPFAVAVAVDASGPEGRGCLLVVCSLKLTTQKATILTISICSRAKKKSKRVPEKTWHAIRVEQTAPVLYTSLVSFNLCRQPPKHILYSAGLHRERTILHFDAF